MFGRSKKANFIPPAPVEPEQQEELCADFGLAMRVCNRPVRISMDAAKLISEAEYYERTMPKKSRAVTTNMRLRAEKLLQTENLWKEKIVNTRTRPFDPVY